MAFEFSRHFIALLFAGFAFSAPAQDSHVICSKSQLRQVPVGFRCKTEKGFSFTLVYRSEKGKEAWRDDQTKIVWGDKLSQRTRRKAAADLCASRIPEENFFGENHLNELPTREDFALAESHGFREVLPNMTNEAYWVKSVVPGAANIGHVFNGNSGQSRIIVYRAINYEHIRCIGR
jgi:hypothetical protein